MCYFNIEGYAFKIIWEKDKFRQKKQKKLLRNSGYYSVVMHPLNKNGRQPYSTKLPSGFCLLNIISIHRIMTKRTKKMEKKIMSLINSFCKMILNAFK